MRDLSVFGRIAVALPLACALLATCIPHARGGETIRDERLGITVTLPDGFVPVPAESRPPDFPFCYARDFSQPDRSLSIAFRGCGVLVMDDKMTTDEIAAIKEDFPGAEIVSEHWKAIRLDVIRLARTDPDGVRRVYYGTSLPFQPEAIAIRVSGPEEQDAEVREQLQSVLRTFDGTPSSSSGQRAHANRFVIKRKHVSLVVLAAFGLLAVLVLLCRRWRRRKNAVRRAKMVIPAPQQDLPLDDRLHSEPY